MQKYLLTLPLPTDGINLIDDSLIADTEAAEGTKNISFKNGTPHTRKGYIKSSTYNFATEPHTLYNYMRNGVRYLLAACGDIIKRQSGDTFLDISGAINSDKIECLTYPCLLGYYDAPYNIKCEAVSGSLPAETYSYKVTTLTANGESTPSQAVTCTLSEAGGVKISWDKVVGATGYKVYGRSAGNWQLISTINSADTLTYTDSSATAASGTPPVENTTAPLAFSDKCLILDGAKYLYYDGDTQLRDVPAYNPTDDEITAYGTNVLITTPDEVKKQKYIVNDDERIWVAGYGKLVRISHLQRPDYFPSTQVWKLEEDCTGMVRFMSEILLFTENTATLVSGTTPNFSLADHYIYKKLPGNYGCSQHRSIAIGDNAVYWANKDGVYRYRYLPTGYSIPECVSEFVLQNGNQRSIRKWLNSITDWSKVFAVYYDHEYRLYIGNKQVIVFDAINSTWTLYEYDKEFNCGMVYDYELYYAKDYLYHMDYNYDPYGPTYDGLSDDGIPIVQDLKSKFFDFGKAANKKKFREIYFTIYTELISYNILLNLNIDNEYEQIPEQIVNTIARMGEIRFGDRLNFKETNLNYPVKIHHKGKKYNVQYELILNDLNMAFTLLSAVLSLKIKELK